MGTISLDELYHRLSSDSTSEQNVEKTAASEEIFESLNRLVGLAKLACYQNKFSFDEANDNQLKNLEKISEYFPQSVDGLFNEQVEMLAKSLEKSANIELTEAINSKAEAITKEMVNQGILEGNEILDKLAELKTKSLDELESWSKALDLSKSAALFSIGSLSEASSEDALDAKERFYLFLQS